MQRRDFITSAGLSSLLLMGLSEAQAQTPLKMPNMPGAKPAPKAVIDIVRTTRECLEAGNACASHCLHMIKGGDNTMADCLEAVLNMQTSCEAMNKLASSGTASGAALKKMTAACAQICHDCAAACKPHATHHEVCKKCMDSCNACAKACEAYA